jgi:hypothetical protein
MDVRNKTVFLYNLKNNLIHYTFSRTEEQNGAQHTRTHISKNLHSKINFVNDIEE